MKTKQYNIFSLYIKAMRNVSRVIAEIEPATRLQVILIGWCIKQGEAALWCEERYFLARNRLKKVFHSDNKEVL